MERTCRTSYRTLSLKNAIDFAVRSCKKLGMDTQGAKGELANVKACVFDVFGTVVDWRSSVIAEATSWGKAKRHNGEVLPRH
jgi:hypothetical protein